VTAGAYGSDAAEPPPALWATSPASEGGR
jgi:hypothetical protein